MIPVAICLTHDIDPRWMGRAEATIDTQRELSRRLTERQMDLLMLMAEGWTQREIATKQCCSVRSVSRRVLELEDALPVPLRRIVPYPSTVLVSNSRERG